MKENWIITFNIYSFMCNCAYILKYTYEHLKLYCTALSAVKTGEICFTSKSWLFLSVSERSSNKIDRM